MDRQTADYRKYQLGMLKNADEYGRTMKILSTTGQTKWLSITEEEFQKIFEILTTPVEDDHGYYLIGDDATRIYENGGIDAVIQADENNVCVPTIFLYDRAIHTEDYLFMIIDRRDHVPISKEEYLKIKSN
jgi:predicted dithiol-disulfide oxidoreductase (DUF899 family)